jgi:hypothetical protein
MNDIELEKALRRAGYDIQWEAAPNGGARAVYALRDGKRHTRSHATLLALAEYLGRVERPLQFVEDRDALETAISKHAEEGNPFVVRRESCRVALYGRNKYVQLVSAADNAPAMYELRSDGLRRVSKGNLPPEVAAASLGAGPGRCRGPCRPATPRIQAIAIQRDRSPARTVSSEATLRSPPSRLLCEAATIVVADDEAPGGITEMRADHEHV